MKKIEGILSFTFLIEYKQRLLEVFKSSNNSGGNIDVNFIYIFQLNRKKSQHLEQETEKNLKRPLSYLGNNQRLLNVRVFPDQPSWLTCVIKIYSDMWVLFPASLDDPWVFHSSLFIGNNSGIQRNTYFLLTDCCGLIWFVSTKFVLRLQPWFNCIKS